MLTRTDEAHYVTYRRLCIAGWPHDRAFRMATAIIEDVKGAGLTFTKRAGQERTADTASLADDAPDQPTSLSVSDLGRICDAYAEGTVVADSP